VAPHAKLLHGERDRVWASGHAALAGGHHDGDGVEALEVYRPVESTEAGEVEEAILEASGEAGYLVRPPTCRGRKPPWGVRCPHARPSRGEEAARTRRTWCHGRGASTTSYHALAMTTMVMSWV